MPEDTALHEAVRYGDLEAASGLLQTGGFDLDQLGLFQWGCLHEAASNGHDQLLRLLLQHGADPNCRDALQGCTPLHYAAEADNEAAAEALIEAGARLDMLSRTGQSPLDAAKGRTRDLLLRKAPLLLRTEPDRIKQNQDLLDSISKVSSDPDFSIPSQSASTQSVNSLGCTELSFEFNAKKDVLKVRVWRLFDLLLPPATNSPIVSLFLRGRIVLGPKGVLKSDTEAVRAYPEADADADTEAEAVFRFKEPLHFRNVTAGIVAERELQITLCVRTRRPPKSHCISRLELPLREAVRRVTKATYPLRPLPEAESRLPDRARVFGSAGQLLRPPLDARSAYSSPSLRGPRVSPCARSASDSELRDAAIDLEALDLPLNGVELLGGARHDLVTVTVHRAEEEVALNVPLIEGEEETSLTSVTEHCASARTAVDVPSIHEEEGTSLTSVTVHRPARRRPKMIVDVPTMEGEEETSLTSVTVHRPARRRSKMTVDVPTMEGEEETSLTSVTVHRAPERALSTAVDVPLIEEEEEEGLTEVLSGGFDNPTFLGSAECLAAEAKRRGGELRVHRSARRRDLELCELP